MPIRIGAPEKTVKEDHFAEVDEMQANVRAAAVASKHLAQGGVGFFAFGKYARPAGLPFFRAS